MEIKTIYEKHISYKFGDSCCKEMTALIHVGSIRLDHNKVLFNSLKSPISFCPFCGAKFEVEDES